VKDLQQLLPKVPVLTSTDFRQEALLNKNESSAVGVKGKFSILALVLCCFCSLGPEHFSVLEVKYYVRKFVFTDRVVNPWNTVPEWIVSADTTNTFKTRFDRFFTVRILYYFYGTVARNWKS